MTQKEFTEIATYICCFFPNFIINSKSNFEITAKYDFFKNMDYNIARLVVKEIITTATYTPKISEILEKYNEYCNPNMKTWDDAWEEAKKAVRFFGMYQEEEALKSVSPLTAKILKRLGYQDLCKTEDTDIAYRANFRNAYEVALKSEKNDSLLPKEVLEIKRALIAQTINGMENRQDKLSAKISEQKSNVQKTIANIKQPLLSINDSSKNKTVAKKLEEAKKNIREAKNI